MWPQGKQLLVSKHESTNCYKDCELLVLLYGSLPMFVTGRCLQEKNRTDRFHSLMLIC